MTDEQRELARRLAAHPRWRWHAGMTALKPIVCGGNAGTVTRVEVLSHDHIPLRWVSSSYAMAGHLDVPTDAYPDLTCPATQGWLLRLLYESASLDLSMMTREGSTVVPTSLPSVHLTYKAWNRPMIEPPAVAYCERVGTALARALLDVWGEP